MSKLSKLNQQIISCRRCPRLVAWREKVAREKTRRFADWDYWGKPAPGFGYPQARLLIVGLAPAAHGTNRTGRMFTGDRSGDWLYRALHKAGFANQPTSENRDDGLQLRDCYITALCRCAPPANKPTPEEFANCSDFLARELTFFRKQWRQNTGGAVLCLGQLSYRYTLQQFAAMGISVPKPRLKFTHGLSVPLADDFTLFCSYHPSQQNTFTGKLTETMFDGVFENIKKSVY